MIKLILLIVLSFVFIILFSNLLTKIRKKEKYNILISGIIVFILIGYYTHLQNQDRKNHFDMIVAFNQNKVLTCNDVNITKDTFNYVSGTASFNGKKNTIFYGMIVRLSDCK